MAVRIIREREVVHAVVVRADLLLLILAAVAVAAVVSERVTGIASKPSVGFSPKGGLAFAAGGRNLRTSGMRHRCHPRCTEHAGDRSA
jgi:hypothetical protein